MFELKCSESHKCGSIFCFIGSTSSILLWLLILDLLYSVGNLPTVMPALSQGQVSYSTIFLSSVLLLWMLSTFPNLTSKGLWRWQSLDLWHDQIYCACAIHHSIQIGGLIPQDGSVTSQNTRWTLREREWRSFSSFPNQNLHFPRILIR